MYFPDFQYGMLNHRCETFVIGSDQCWNDRLHEEGRDYFYLDFVSADRKKVSYAASFGRPEGAVPKKRGQKLFGRFQAVSVREEFDVELFEKSYGIAAYILNPTEEKRKFCLSLQKSLGNMKLINIIDAYKEYGNENLIDWKRTGYRTGLPMRPRRGNGR